MEALFIVPAMVSPQVNEKLIPALSKLIERNILLNNGSLFKKAAIEKYARRASWVREDTIPITVISDGFIDENSSYMHNLGSLIFEKSQDYVEDYKKIIDVKRNKFENETDPRKKFSALKDYHESLKDVLPTLASHNSPKSQLEIKKMSTEIRRLESMYDADLNKINADTAKNSATARKIDAELQDRDELKDFGKQTKSAELQTFNHGHNFASLDAIEHPTGVKFFSQISLEPTVMEIPISLGVGDSEQQMMVRVGVKCIPYIIDDVTSLINLLNEAKNMNWVERQFKNLFRKINTKIWLTNARAINKGRHTNPDEAARSVKFSPNRNELTKVTNLANAFSSKDSSAWSTMIILSSHDIKDNADLVALVSNYRKMTQYVIGDLVITNETKESAYFCTPRMNHCQEIPFDYMKKILNLKDVLDYSEASRASAWKVQSAKTAISETLSYKSVEQKVNDILRG